MILEVEGKMLPAMSHRYSSTTVSFTECSVLRICPHITHKINIKTIAPAYFKCELRLKIPFIGKNEIRYQFIDETVIAETQIIERTLLSAAQTLR